MRRSETMRDGAFADIDKWRKQYNGTVSENAGDATNTMIRNITYELVESQISTVIPAPHVDAKVWSERHGRNAKAIERLLINLRNELPFERLNDIDERTVFVEGGSVWLIEWDETITAPGEQGGVRLSCISAEDFFPQPGIYEVEDMDWLILRLQSTREEIVDKYGVSIEVAGEAQNDDPDSIEDEDTCTVYMCFYKNEQGFVSQYVWSGDTELSDVEDYYARKRYVCGECGKRRELCESDKHCDCGGKFIMENEEYEELTHEVVLADGFTISANAPAYDERGNPRLRKATRFRTDPDGNTMTTAVDGVSVPLTEEYEERVMEPTRIEWYRPKHYPVVVRKNISKRRSVLGQSDCEFILPQQREINAVETRICQKIQAAGVYPVKPENLDFQYDATVGEKVLNLPEGRSFRDSTGVLDLTPNLTTEQNQSERLYEHAKKILGITNSYQGQADTTAKSGVAKQAQIAQAAGRLDSKRVMKHAAYADIDRVIFELYLAYADEPRSAAYVDAFGRMQNSSFNRYDFLEWDDATHKWIYEDRYLFSVDQNGGVDMQREQLWQLNLQNFSSGVYGNPQDPATLLRYWQMQEQAHYPHARENVEYFKELVERAQAASASMGAMQAGQGAAPMPMPQ